MEKLRDVANLVIAQRRKSRHPLRRPAITYRRPNHLSLVVVQDHRRPQEIWSGAAPGISAMAKATVGAENLGAFGCHFGIRHPTQAKKLAGAKRPIVFLGLTCSLGRCWLSLLRAQSCDAQ